MSESRAGARVAREARRREWEAVRHLGWRLAVFPGGVVALAGMPLLIWPSAWAGVFAGAVGTFSVCATTFLVMQMANTTQVRGGADCEVMTAGALAPLRRRGWILCDHVPYRDQRWRGSPWVDVDHLVVGEHVAYAIESKWRSRTWDAEMLTKPLQQARDEAHAAKGLLRSVDHRVDTEPVLVLWGRVGALDLPASIDGGPVMHGRDVKAWRRQLPAVGRDDRPALVDLARRLEAQIVARDAAADPERDEDGRFVRRGPMALAETASKAMVVGSVAVLLVSFALTVVASVV